MEHIISETAKVKQLIDIVNILPEAQHDVGSEGSQIET